MGVEQDIKHEFGILRMEPRKIITQNRQKLLWKYDGLASEAPWFVPRCQGVLDPVVSCIIPKLTDTQRDSEKNPHAHKNKIGTSTPPLPPFHKNHDPPKRRNFMGIGAFFQQKEPKNARRPQNWHSHFRPQNRGRKFYGHEAFSDSKKGVVRF